MKAQVHCTLSKVDETEFSSIRHHREFFWVVRTDEWDTSMSMRCMCVGTWLEEGDISPVKENKRLIAKRRILETGDKLVLEYSRVAFSDPKYSC